MTITSEKEKECLAKDIKFFSPQHNTYCLGRTLEEAAEIIRCIKQERGQKSERRVYEH